MSATMVAILAAILYFTKNRNQVKIAVNGIFFLCLTGKIVHKLALCIILSTVCTFMVKKDEKQAFSLKHGLTTCYL